MLCAVYICFHSSYDHKCTYTVYVKAAEKFRVNKQMKSENYKYNIQTKDGNVGQLVNLFEMSQQLRQKLMSPKSLVAPTGQNLTLFNTNTH